MVREVGGLSLLLDQKQPGGCKGQHNAQPIGDLWGVGGRGEYGLVEPSFPCSETLAKCLRGQEALGSLMA